MANLYKMTKKDCIYELAGLSDARNNPARFIKAIATDPEIKKIQIIMFSDNEAYENGKALAKFIELKNLGKIRQTKPEKSLNTGSIINTWVWELDKQALENWSNTTTVIIDPQWDRIGKGGRSQAMLGRPAMSCGLRVIQNWGRMTPEEIMKMISKTRKISVRGVILISATIASSSFSLKRIAIKVSWAVRR